MRNNCICLTVSTLLISLGWYADHARSSCNVSCTVSACVQQDDGGTVQGLYFSGLYFYADMYHNSTPAECKTPYGPVLYTLNHCTATSPHCPSGFGGASLRSANTCTNIDNENTEQLEACLTCMGYGP